MGFLKDLVEDKIDEVTEGLRDAAGDLVGRPLGDTEDQQDPNNRVDNRTADLRYPLEQDTYKATVTFTVLEEKYTGNQALMSDIAEKKREDAEALKQASEERSESGENPPDEKSNKDKLQEYAKSEFNNFIAPKQTVMGKSVTMYLPLGLTFNDNVAYNNVQLGQLGATLETGLGLAASMAQGVGSFIENFKGPTAPAGGDLAKLAAIRLGKELPMVGAEASLAARVTGGVTLNPNERAVFDQPNIREFAFNFKMIARSKAEQRQVNEIIRHLRTELYPEEILAPIGEDKKARNISLGYKFPNKFKIEFHYDGKQIPGLAKIMPCFLQGVDTVYNAGQMAFHEDGNFMEVDMTLRFRETRALTKERVIKEGF